jgi:hypothetical protein
MNKIKKIIQILIKENPPKKDYATTFIWYHFITTNSDITLSEINEYFIENALPKYNSTYLKNNLRSSKNITKGIRPNSYKPVRKYIDELTDKYAFAVIKSEDIVTDDSILPEILISSTRGYIESLGRQINSSYNNNIFDGCAVLMRRLLEILLIHSYEEIGKISTISENDGLKNLSYIINYTISNKPFKLSKDSNETLDDFRQLGNFSAHKIQYNAKRKDIDNIKLKYRMTIEELLYASNFKK